jgi:hypothetical protein
MAKRRKFQDSAIDSARKSPPKMRLYKESSAWTGRIKHED